MDFICYGGEVSKNGSLKSFIIKKIYPFTVVAFRRFFMVQNHAFEPEGVYGL